MKKKKKTTNESGEGGASRGRSLAGLDEVWGVVGSRGVAPMMDRRLRHHSERSDCYVVLSCCRVVVLSCCRVVVLSCCRRGVRRYDEALVLRPPGPALTFRFDIMEARADLAQAPSVVVVRGLVDPTVAPTASGRSCRCVCAPLALSS